MNRTPENFEELGWLLAELCEGQLSSDQALRLEQLANASPQAQQFFLDYVHLNGELWWAYSGLTADEALGPAVADSMDAPCDQPQVDAAAGSLPRTADHRQPGAVSQKLRVTSAGSTAERTKPQAELQAADAPSQRCETPRRGWARFLREHRRWTGAAALASTVVLALLVWAWVGQPGSPGLRPEPRGTVHAARLVRSYLAQWGKDAEWPAPGQEPLLGQRIGAGQSVSLRQGVAELCFEDGARVILEGPTRVRVDGSDSATLESGRLVALVPRPATGFSLHAGSLTLVDQGTEFAVAVQDDGPRPGDDQPNSARVRPGQERGELHVLAGRVELRHPAYSRHPGHWPRTIEAGRAVAWHRLGSRSVRLESIPVRPGAFVRVVPRPGSVASMRWLVARHPQLLHHYPFEGNSPSQRLLDQRGSLHLTEVVMRGGRGGGLDLAAPGYDGTTLAISPYRLVAGGNEVGTALQSEGTFAPPEAMTLELLVRFAGHPRPAAGSISCAVATRSSQQQCGFFLVAADHGQLVHLFDGNAPWTESNVQLVPGDWYYVAATFQAEHNMTRINTYLANLSRGERTLQWVVRDALAEGQPGASRLGIGKGFDAALTHAYPWSGSIDEVAIYGAVLDRAVLEEHLRALSIHEPLEAGRVVPASMQKGD